MKSVPTLLIACGTFAVGLLLTLSHAYIAVAAELPDGLPGARMGTNDITDGDLIVTPTPANSQFLGLSPGDRRYWLVQASLVEAESGRLSLRVFGSGEVVNHPRSGLTIAVESCTEPYVGTNGADRPICPASPTAVIPTTNLASISTDPDEVSSPHTWVLADIHSDSDRYFLATLAIPSAGASDKSLMGLSGNFGMGLFASGDNTPSSSTDPDSTLADTARSSPGTSLPDTGGPMLALLLLGTGSLGLGLVVRARAKRRGKVAR